MTLVHMVDSAQDLIRVQETGRWAHINVKLLHLRLVVNTQVDQKWPLVCHLLALVLHSIYQDILDF